MPRLPSRKVPPSNRLRDRATTQSKTGMSCRPTLPVPTQIPPSAGSPRDPRHPAGPRTPIRPAREHLSTRLAHPGSGRHTRNRPAGPAPTHLAGARVRRIASGPSGSATPVLSRGLPLSEHTPDGMTAWCSTTSEFAARPESVRPQQTRAPPAVSGSGVAVDRPTASASRTRLLRPLDATRIVPPTASAAMGVRGARRGLSRAASASRTRLPRPLDATREVPPTADTTMGVRRRPVGAGRGASPTASATAEVRRLIGRRPSARGIGNGLRARGSCARCWRSPVWRRNRSTRRGGCRIRCGRSGRPLYTRCGSGPIRENGNCGGVGGCGGGVCG